MTFDDTNRLLRNRVSAQQARERKKVYVNELESSAVELEEKNSNLEEQISTLINENTMLRKVPSHSLHYIHLYINQTILKYLESYTGQILMNTRAKVDDN